MVQTQLLVQPLSGVQEALVALSSLLKASCSFTATTELLEQPSERELVIVVILGGLGGQCLHQAPL